MGKHNSSRRPLPQGQSYVIGRNPVSEMLRTQADRILEAWVANGVEGASDRGRELLEDLRRCGVSIKYLPKEKLSERVGTDSHQGFALVVTARKVDGLTEFYDQWRAAAQGLFLALDSINDPHNLGAILRAAECFGVDGVLWSRNRGAQTSAVVSKVSAGASELVPTIEVGNLVESVKKIKTAGFWVVGAEIGSAATALTAFKFPEKCLLVLGSEGEGLKPLLKQQLDFSVYIPMFGQIDSLNVSQAAAVLLFSFRQQFPKSP